MGCAGGDDGTVGDAGGGKGSGDCTVLSAAAAFEPIAAAAFEPGDATSCFASHASLAASSLDSAEHAYSVPSLHISAIEISSAPHAGASSSSSSDVAAAAAAFGATAPCCDGGGAPCGGAPRGGAPTGALLPAPGAADSGVPRLPEPSASASVSNAAAARAPPGQGQG